MASLSRSQSLLLVVLLGVALAVAGKRLAAAGTATAPARAGPLLEAAAPGRTLARRSEAAAPARLVVHVVGAVQRAGLYRLPEGARVADAVARAGGTTQLADLTAVNLAAPLVDGQQVVVVARVAARAAESGARATSAPVAPAAGRKVSLGAATAADLDALPGIGPVTAQKIVDWRAAHGPFRSVEDLDDVPGIGPARIEQLRDLVTP